MEVYIWKQSFVLVEKYNYYY